MQFCSKCGQQVTPGSSFCASCGNPVTAPPQPPSAPAQPVQSIPAPQLPQQAAPIYVQVAAPAPPKNAGLKVLLWLGVGAAILVVMILVAVLFFQVGQKAQTDVIGGGVSSAVSEPSSDPSSADSAPAPPDQPTSNVAAMQSVLKQDADLRATAKQALNDVNIQSSDDFDKVAAIMRGYVSEARQIDTTNCPRDFAEAFSLHLSAWTQLADSVAGHPDVPQGDDAFIYGFLRGEQGDPTGGAVELQDEVKSWVKDLQDRESLVDRAEGDLDAIAVKYGAK